MIEQLDQGTWLINNVELLQFNEDTHTYFLNGNQCQSVTRIVRSILGDSYANVPQAILRAKAEYGNQVHEWIEWYITSPTRRLEDITNFPILTKTQKRSIDQFVKDYKFLYTDYTERYTERPVSLFGKYCGMYDLLLINDIETVLCDIKTTAKLDIEYLEWQLGFYKLGLKKQGINVDRCAVLWIPKNGLIEYVEITPKTEEECLEALRQYEEKQKN